MGDIGDIIVLNWELRDRYIKSWDGVTDATDSLYNKVFKYISRHDNIMAILYV